MKVKFAFLGDNKFMATIAAMRLGLLSLLLLLLPASLGLDGTIIQEEAFGQFNLPLLEDEDTNTTTTSPTTPTTPLLLLLTSLIPYKTRRYFYYVDS
jgi:hypothetical protein